MRVSVLASGSKGNSTYIETEKHHFLIDLGTSSLCAEKRLKELGADPKKIEGIFITHSHTDHIAGLRVFIKKYSPTIYLTKKIYKEVKDIVPLPLACFIEEELSIEDFHIGIFKTSHDTEESVGYIFTEKEKSVVYVTDTGYINLKNEEKLKNKSLYIMESNHDTEMLLEGKYPYYLKQRILGDRGHLSNADSAYYMTKFIGENTHKIILAHLSHENNTEEKALDTYKEVFHKKNLDFDAIVVAKQEEKTELIEV